MSEALLATILYVRVETLGLGAAFLRFGFALTFDFGFAFAFGLTFTFAFGAALLRPDALEDEAFAFRLAAAKKEGEVERARYANKPETREVH